MHTAEILESINLNYFKILKFDRLIINFKSLIE